MSCEFVIERLESYLSREIDAADAARIASHLETCLACAEELSLVHACREAYRDRANEQPGDRFTDRVMAALPKTAVGTARILRLSMRVVAAAAAIVLLVVLLDRDRTGGLSAGDGTVGSHLVAAGTATVGTSHPRTDSTDAGGRVETDGSGVEAGGRRDDVPGSASAAIPAAFPVVRYVSAMEQDLAARMKVTGETSDPPVPEALGETSAAAHDSAVSAGGRETSTHQGSKTAPFPSSGFTVVVASLVGPGETWQDGGRSAGAWGTGLH